MKKSRFRHLARIAPFVVLLGLAYFGLAFRDVLWNSIAVVLADTQQDPVPVWTVQKEDFTVTIAAEGEIAGLESAPIQSPRSNVGALALSWLAPEGSFVEAGEPVVQFDSTEALLRLEQQQIALAEIEQRYRITLEDQRAREKSLAADLAIAELEYEYSLDRIPRDETIVSRWDAMEATTDSALAEARVDFLSQKQSIQERIDRSDREILAIEKKKAEAEMEVARQILDSLEIKSPASGLFLYRRDRGEEPKVGEMYWPGQVLGEIVDIGKLQARLYVFERDAGSLTTGKEVSIRLEALPDRSYHGTLQSVAPLPQPLERNSPLRYFTCEVSLHMDREHLKHIRPGMTLHAEIITERYDSCFILPASAVTVKDTEEVVYLQNGEDFLPRAVQAVPGPHGLTVVTGGIENGEIVALRNPFETRMPHLPDFGKALAGTDSPPPWMRRMWRR